MGWQKAGNATLNRLTGFEVRRVRGKGIVPALGGKSPYDFDGEVQEIITAVQPFTMTSPEKINALVLAVRYIHQHQIPGDVVECGVWRGGSMQAVARTLLSLGETTRDLWLFDTYEGMSEPTHEDRRFDGHSAEHLLTVSGRESTVWAVASLEDVQSGFTSLPYPAERIHYVRGMVEETVPEHAPRAISILRLDTDWYESTKHEMEHLYPRLVRGGVLLLDDYGYWQGARKAVDEFVEKTGERLLLVPVGDGRIAVKP